MRGGSTRKAAASAAAASASATPFRMAVEAWNWPSFNAVTTTSPTRMLWMPECCMVLFLLCVAVVRPRRARVRGAARP